MLLSTDNGDFNNYFLSLMA